MAEKLLVGVLGHRNAGKSTTWETLFDRRVRTTKNKLRRLYLNGDESEWVDVVLVNGSPEERKENIEEILQSDSPRIVLCSMQYHPNVNETLSYFEARDYDGYIHWLNPGYRDRAAYQDNLALRARLERAAWIVEMRDGKKPPINRVAEIREFVEQWTRPRGLIRSTQRLAAAGA